MLKEFRVTFRIHQFGREKIQVPEGALFIRLYYDPESWNLTLYFMYQDPQEVLEERTIIFNNKTPYRNVDYYLGKFMAKTTSWYVYYE
ncbi:MAG: hypothetical protein US57_C0006G0005 [Candidatus Moranbacteria bacterium GW2011_GWC2_37_73]|nr:MAG: hypothetical protein UR95_C0007G0009 [Parcubacteria group bacterium GW2011_GWC1_36_108]KKQ00060.1 MAG: hypothetical protein US09_C0022G0006 [Candidatus Moranbacteria bacterium GW2011_GWD1_36_198]KKQ01158.1 MAG: hypothetical protein US10_C0021G0016 [Candidatus Moranbacteria bacterium GW2011_GWD2_36_198]KKQ39933.1 MAG: hypothetical protein US57_C0006G0005 [Candidatus Moranbacteria bacterium GW2011_GWC2_37_73]HAR99682.1 hypothetical protein [Candidatus Moranbacteria bacterium]